MTKKTKDEDTKLIGVDFDGTLAEYDGWKGHHHLGKPIPAMIEKVKEAIAEGHHIVVFTARTNPGHTYEDMLQATESVILIAQWCQKHIGVLLPVTYAKTKEISEFWDDRGREVIKNEGAFLSELMD